MGYVENNLLQGESVVHKTKYHWIYFLVPALIFSFLILTGIGGVYLKFDTPEGYGGFGMAEAFIITGVLTMANAVINYLTSEFTVTNKRVVVKLGFIKRTSLEMNMEKIEGIIIHQSILGRILNYGHVEVRGTGGSSQPFKLIKKPMELKNKVQEIQGGIK